MKKNILEYSNYYLKCDFLNKYHLQNIYYKPCIDKITLKISLNQLINSFSFSEKLNHIDAFFLFYSNFSLFPYSTFSLISNKKDKVEKFDSCIKIVLTKKSDIDFFLFRCFNQNKLKRSFNPLKKVYLGPKISLNFKVPITFLAASTNLELDNENYFRINLILKTVLKIKNVKLIFQNLF